MAHEVGNTSRSRLTRKCTSEVSIWQIENVVLIHRKKRTGAMSLRALRAPALAGLSRDAQVPAHTRQAMTARTRALLAVTPFRWAWWRACTLLLTASLHPAAGCSRNQAYVPLHQRICASAVPCGRYPLAPASLHGRNHSAGYPPQYQPSPRAVPFLILPFFCACPPLHMSHASRRRWHSCSCGGRGSWGPGSACDLLQWGRERPLRTWSKTSSRFHVHSGTAR
jgi:hypothetical protein